MIEAFIPAVLIAGAIYAWIYPRNIMLSIGARAPNEWKLKYAGYIKTLDINISPVVIAGIKLGGFILGLIIAVLMWSYYGSIYAIMGVFLSLLSLIVPDLYLEYLEKKRLEELSREFPVMVTLVQVFSKAADLQKALGIVRFAVSGELNKQLTRLGSEMAIYPMSVALNNFAVRCNYLPISNFVSVLQYGIDSGADIDSILDTFSSRTYENRVSEVKKKIKSRPTITVIISAVMMLVFVLLLIFPMYSNIVLKLNNF